MYNNKNSWKYSINVLKHAVKTVAGKGGRKANRFYEEKNVKCLISMTNCMELKVRLANYVTCHTRSHVPVFPY